MFMIKQHNVFWAMPAIAPTKNFVRPSVRPYVPLSVPMCLRSLSGVNWLYWVWPTLPLIATGGAVSQAFDSGVNWFLGMACR